MNEALLIGLASPLATVVVQLIIARSNRGHDDVQRARRDQRLDDRLDGIERKLDEHNHYAERLGNIEREMVGIKKDIESIKKGVSR